MMDKNVLIVIDSNSLIHRAFHALPPLTTKEGKQVGAVYGFLLVFFKALKDFQPDFVAAAFDVPGPTFRHKEYKSYKAKRPKMPLELSQQIPRIKDILRLFGVPIFEKEKFEGDDIIGTISKLAPKKQAYPKIETIILSGDKDILQLVNAQTKACNLRKGVKNTVLYDVEKIKEEYQGLLPEQLLEYKGLRGDPSDNIPGVPGIGEKTGIELIKKFESIENLYRALRENKEETKEMNPRIKEILLQHKEEAFLSRRLIKINCSVPIDFDIKDCRFNRQKKEKIIKFLEELGFNSLIKRLLEPGILEKKIISNKKQRALLFPVF